MVICHNQKKQEYCLYETKPGFFKAKQLQVVLQLLCSAKQVNKVCFTVVEQLFLRFLSTLLQKQNRWKNSGHQLCQDRVIPKWSSESMVLDPLLIELVELSSLFLWYSSFCKIVLIKCCDKALTVLVFNIMLYVKNLVISRKMITFVTKKQLL